MGIGNIASRRIEVLFYVNWHARLGLPANYVERSSELMDEILWGAGADFAGTADGNGGVPMTNTLYMVVEHFKNKDAVPVYRRFRDNGRMAPEGLIYVSSWIDVKLERCYQLMETLDRRLLDEWMANWSDLVNFEVHAVITSKEAAEKIAPRL